MIDSIIHNDVGMLGDETVKTFESYKGYYVNFVNFIKEISIIYSDWCVNRQVSFTDPPGGRMKSKPRGAMLSNYTPLYSKPSSIFPVASRYLIMY